MPPDSRAFATPTYLNVRAGSKFGRNTKIGRTLPHKTYLRLHNYSSAHKDPMPEYIVRFQVFVDELGMFASPRELSVESFGLQVQAPHPSEAARQVAKAIQRMLERPKEEQPDAERILALLTRFHPHADDRLLWLTTPHAELDDLSPLLLIVQGKTRVVRDMLEAAYMGLPT